MKNALHTALPHQFPRLALYHDQRSSCKEEIEAKEKAKADSVAAVAQAQADSLAKVEEAAKDVKEAVKK